MSLKKFLKVALISTSMIVFLMGCGNSDVNETPIEDVLNEDESVIETETEDAEELNTGELKSESDNTFTDTFIFPDSNTTKLTLSKISELDKDKVSYARNEIFARNGHIFQTEKYANYFSSKDWYTPLNQAGEYEINEIELYNARLFQMLEKTVNLSTNFNLTFQPNESLFIDLSGNGENEEVLLVKNTSANAIELSINDQNIDLGFKLYSEPAIININKNDNYQEILVQKQDENTNVINKYYRFDGETIQKIGKTPSEIFIDGSGYLLTSIPSQDYSSEIAFYKLSDEASLQKIDW